jgi:hypothetical protein
VYIPLENDMEEVTLANCPAGQISVCFTVPAGQLKPATHANFTLGLGHALPAGQITSAVDPATQ